MSNDGGAPATKDDIRMLMEEFGKMWMWKDDMDEWRAETDQWKIAIEAKMDLRTQELKDHFDLVA